MFVKELIVRMVARVQLLTIKFVVYVLKVSKENTVKVKCCLLFFGMR